MKKFLSSAVVFVCVLFTALPCFAENVSNCSFEIYEEGQPPAGWYSESYNQNAHHFFSAPGGIDGSYCAALTNSVSTDSRITQKIECRPSSIYKLTAYAKTEGVNSSADAAGASISVQEDGENYGHNSESSIKLDDECTEWTELTLYFTTGYNTSCVYIWLRLGDYSMDNSGTAFFDNVTVQQADTVPDGEKCAVLGQPNAGAGAALRYLPLLGLIVLIIVFIIVMLIKKRPDHGLWPDFGHSGESRSESQTDGVGADAGESTDDI